MTSVYREKRTYVIILIANLICHWKQTRLDYFLQDFCAFTEIKNSSFAVTIYAMIVATKDSEFFWIATSVYIKIDASSITQNDCYVHLFSAVTSFSFSGDVYVTMWITSLMHKCTAARFALLVARWLHLPVPSDFSVYHRHRRVAPSVAPRVARCPTWSPDRWYSRPRWCRCSSDRNWSTAHRPELPAAADNKINIIHSHRRQTLSKTESYTSEWITDI